MFSRASSKLANGIRNWISQDTIRDTGCSLKVFRADAIQAIPLFEGMHRFLPTLMRYYGFDPEEIWKGNTEKSATIHADLFEAYLDKAN